MKSFNDNLEILEVAPRFLDFTALVQLRRDSSAGRLGRDTSVIFLQKRERLESGDFPTLSQDSRFKKEYRSNFNNPSHFDKPYMWNKNVANQCEVGLNFVEIIPISDNIEPKVIEEESVIDHQLTVENCELVPAVVVVRYPEPTPIKSTIISEPKFVIKVKKTDSKIILSGQNSVISHLEAISDNEYPVDDEMQEEKINNLIFVDEPTRLNAKMLKIAQYWGQTLLLIPNVFRLLKTLEENKESYLEFQDYSRKELLVQSNGLKCKSSCNKKKGVKKVKKCSGGNVAGLDA